MSLEESVRDGDRDVDPFYADVVVLYGISAALLFSNCQLSVRLVRRLCRYAAMLLLTLFLACRTGFGT